MAIRVFLFFVEAHYICKAELGRKLKLKHHV
jgi:hypothetical protein